MRDEIDLWAWFILTVADLDMVSTIYHDRIDGWLLLLPPHEPYW